MTRIELIHGPFDGLKLMVHEDQEYMEFPANRHLELLPPDSHLRKDVRLRYNHLYVKSSIYDFEYKGLTERILSNEPLPGLEAE